MVIVRAGFSIVEVGVKDKQGEEAPMIHVLMD